MNRSRAAASRLLCAGRVDVVGRLDVVRAVIGGRERSAKSDPLASRGDDVVVRRGVRAQRIVVSQPPA
jgi:hypothetical protein